MREPIQHYHFSVPVRPEGKQIKKGRYGQIYVKPKTKEIMRRIGEAAKICGIDSKLLSKPVSIIIIANFKPTKSISEKKCLEMIKGVFHTSKPDRDNIDKLVSDSLKGIAWNDDRQVFKGTVMKQHAYKNSIDVSLSYYGNI